MSETEEDTKKLLEILAEMGATDIEFKDELGTDTSMSFVLNQIKVEISGQWHNDDTAGLFVEITPL